MSGASVRCRCATGVAAALALAATLACSTGAAREPLADKHLLFPLKGYDRANLRDNFGELRGVRKHEALDIMAPRGTPVIAVEDGRVAKLFRSALGGITIYQFDPSERYAYYYAHLDRYAPD